MPSTFASIARSTPWIRLSITGSSLLNPRAGALAVVAGKGQISCPVIWLSGYLVSFERGTLGEADREHARQWLDNQPGFACIQCVELSDVWHGPWEE